MADLVTFLLGDWVALLNGRLDWDLLAVFPWNLPTLLHRFLDWDLLTVLPRNLLTPLMVAVS